MSNGKFFWIDVETTGLDPLKDIVLEVSLAVTDTDLNILDIANWIIQMPGAKSFVQGRVDRGEEGADHVMSMHEETGLWADVASPKAFHSNDAERLMHEFLDEHGVTKKNPLCGSSVHFDRAFMAVHFPDVMDRFHYRNIDISTLKELCAELQPEMFAYQKGDVAKLQVTPYHRADNDVENTITEAKWYFDNFLFLPTVDFGVSEPGDI